MESIRELARHNFDRWNAALQSKIPDYVASLYTEDATFLPTMSGEFKKGKDGAREYFTHLLEKKPSVTITEEEIQPLAPHCYMHSGMYNFTVGPDENRQIVEARFSFVWQRNNKGEWKIIHHHSSLKPEPEGANKKPEM